MRNRVVFLVLALLALPFYAGSSSYEDKKTEIQKVEVVNLAKTQEVVGTVSVNGRLSHSAMDRKQRLVVPPAPRDTKNMLSAGTIEADGFTSMIVSLQGEFQSSTFAPGAVGAILIPDETPFLRAFNEDGVILLPQEIKSELSQSLFPYFTSKSEKFTVGFPTYRVFVYNTTSTSVELNLYVYLTN